MAAQQPKSSLGKAGCGQSENQSEQPAIGPVLATAHFSRTACIAFV